MQITGYKLFFVITVLSMFTACSENDDEKSALNNNFIISVPLTVESGTTSTTKGVDEYGRPEGNYPLSKVYMWVYNENTWKVLGLPYKKPDLRIALADNADGTVRATQDGNSIVFNPGDKIVFLSQDNYIVSLPDMNMVTPGGKKMYGMLDDVLFQSSYTFKYDAKKKDIVRGISTSISQGLEMVRYSTCIYLNIVMTSINNYENVGNRVTYSLTEDMWQDAFGNSPVEWMGRGYVSNFSLRYDLMNKVLVNDGQSVVVTLENDYQNFRKMKITNVDNNTGLESIYEGFGGGSFDYKFLYVTSTVNALNISFRDPTGQTVTAGVTIGAFMRNETYGLDIVMDYEDLYVAMDEAGYLRSGTRKGIEIPAKVFLNGKLIQEKITYNVLGDEASLF